MDTIGLPRRLLAEFIGTALLVTVVVGSGIAAERLSPDDVGLQLLENSTATVFGLAVLILLFGPVSGAHFNPVVTAAEWLLGRSARTGMAARHVAAYVVVQIAGGVAGALLANVMYDRKVFELATKERITTGQLVGEVVATAGLIAVIFALARTGRVALSAASDVIVTMGCGDACPVFTGHRYEEWVLPDPAGQPVDAVRPVRDEIEGRVRQLLRDLGVTATR